MLPRWTLFIQRDKCVDLQSNHEIKKEVDFFHCREDCCHTFRVSLYAFVRLLHTKLTQ